MADGRRNRVPSLWTAIAILFLANGSVAGAADSRYWTTLGDSQLESQKYGDAVYSYTTAIVKGPETSELHARRGWAHYQLGNYAIALLDFDQAIAGNVKRADYFNKRGLTYHALDNYSAAITDFTKSLKLKPANAEV